MTDAPLHEAASSDSESLESFPADTPTIDELDRVAFDAVVRNAPRFGRFIGTGVAIGAAAGFIIGLVLPNSTSLGRGVVALLVASGFAIIGGLVAAALVVGIDGTHRAPVEPGFPWEPPTATPEPEAPSVGQSQGDGDARGETT